MFPLTRSGLEESSAETSVLGAVGSGAPWLVTGGGGGAVVPHKDTVVD